MLKKKNNLFFNGSPRFASKSAAAIVKPRYAHTSLVAVGSAK